MRTPLVAGNWKMNRTVAEARDFVSVLVGQINPIEGVEKVLCPPFIALLAVSALLEGTDIHLGAQNMFWETQGAFTGEISPLMVKELCRYVILGHSERRAYFGETDEGVNKKLRAAETASLVPIVCVGETLQEYESNRTRAVIEKQILGSLSGIPPTFAKQIVVAYEPVWAIGTGRASSGQDANTVVAEIIRPVLARLFGQEITQAIRVLYGGSVTAVNASELFAQPEIDGALVGGASLKVNEMVAITQAAARR